jgi:hypothetical protein
MLDGLGLLAGQWGGEEYRIIVIKSIEKHSLERHKEMRDQNSDASYGSGVWGGWN